MKAKNIAIIGCGQLGSRHLQALASVKEKINIQVIDPSKEALETGETRFNEVSNNCNSVISFHQNIENLAEKLDVVIIASNSKIRRGIIEQLVTHAKIEYLILEKVLFVSEEDYDSVKELLEKHSIKAWVNCARRMMDLYSSIQKELKGPVHFSAAGNNWGLGCNGIHLLDLFAFFIKSNDIKLSNKLVDKTVLESKRSGYVEFTGTIRGYSGDNSFQITSFKTGSSGIQLSISTPSVRYVIQEGVAAKVWVSKLDNNWIMEERSFKMPFQSQLTNLVVDALLSSGTCSLTTFEESAVLHVLFIDNLISFLREVRNDNSINECLIT